MKKTAILIFLSLVLTGCNNSPQTATEVSQPAANTNISAQRAGNSLIVSSHSTDKGAVSTTPTGSNSSSARSPMEKPVDVTEMTANIEKSEKAYKSKTTDEKAKSALAEAYFVRAFALTEAAQYRAALGDFRKGLKLNPSAKEANQMHDQILSIFQSINREPPKEGEEPPPLPFKKTT
jgi:tetratricopeptide (TPR) repeat protein